MAARTAISSSAPTSVRRTPRRTPPSSARTAQRTSRRCHCAPIAADGDVDVAWTLLGVALIAIALRDIFDVLFHPLGKGMVAQRVVRAVSATAIRAKRAGTVALLAGPLGYVAVVATWAALLAVGWA